MQYGYFDDEKREYVVTRPDTPKPWSNYIGNSEFGSVMTNNAAGYTFYKSAAQGRLTRFRFNINTAEMPGKIIYIRDQKDGDYWCNAWMPVGKPLDQYHYECRFGSGYSILTSEYSGINCQTTYFVPLGKNYEVWWVNVENKSSEDRSISLFPFLEPQTNWNATDDATNLQYTQYVSRTEVIDGIIDIGSNVNMPEDPEHFENKDQKRHTFFAVSGAPVAGYEGDLTEFMGAYGTYGAPQAVVSGRCKNSVAVGDNPCAALQVDLDLAPGETARFAVLFGVGGADSAGLAAQNEMSDPAVIQECFDSVKNRWHSRLNTLHAKTPDAGFNSMVNMWAPFNNLMTFYWSRAASMVYAGARDGLGYRDTVQDIVGATGIVLDEAAERLELMLTGQLSTGGALPVVKPFAHKPGQEPEPSNYRADDSLWLFNAVPEYVKETGDIGFYRKVLPYADKGEATVLGHLRRAIEFNLERSGAHGLPCGLHADWNDCIRLGEKGESVFVAFQLRYGLKEYIDISRRIGEEAEVTWAEEQLAALDRNLEEHAWDGEWYLRAYRFDGQKFGSKENDEGSIFMNAQTWAILSEHAGDKSETVMQSMHDKLATDYGVMVCTPPYVHTDPQVCLGRLMNPGMKENGGIFNHTQGWAVMAAAQLGMNDRAWEYLNAVMPASFNDKAEVRQVEPYVVCQSTHSSFSPRYGAGRLSWLSGSAVWNYYAMTHAILGIKPHYDGLEIDPCLPSEWDGFSAVREFRGRSFEIKVTKHALGKGTPEIKINGKAVEGSLIPAAMFEDKNTVEVQLV